MYNMKNKILITIPFLVYIILLPLYINTYKNLSNTFWIVFIIERIFSFLYEDKLTDFLDDEEETLNKVKHFDRYILLGIILFGIIGISALIYIALNYFRLFIILIIGELLDKIFDNARNSFRKYKTMSEV